MLVGICVFMEFGWVFIMFFKFKGLDYVLIVWLLWYYECLLVGVVGGLIGVLYLFLDGILVVFSVCDLVFSVGLLFVVILVGGIGVLMMILMEVLVIGDLVDFCIEILVFLVFFGVLLMSVVSFFIVIVLFLNLMVFCFSKFVCVWVWVFLSGGSLFSECNLRLLRNCLVVVYSVGWFGML